MVEQARSFDRAAEEYEQGRPGWPGAMLDTIPLAADATVLDLGAGTGKLTRTLARRYARVIAVEPLAGMRAILDRELPAVESHEGSAEAIPLPDASVDGVFCGQSFHWFASEAAVAEIARVLRSGGVLVAAWNTTDDEAPSPLPEAYRAYFGELHAPSLAAVQAGPSVEDLLARGPFGPIGAASVTHEQVQDRAGVLAFARSMSWIARRSDDERESILRRLDELLPRGPFVFPMRAEVQWAVRR